MRAVICHEFGPPESLRMEEVGARRGRAGGTGRGVAGQLGCQRHGSRARRPDPRAAHAAVAFSEWLSITYGNRGIGVRCLCPGAVETPMFLAQSEKRQALMAGPAGRMTLEELAASVVEGLREERFLIVPHLKILDYVRGKADDLEGWGHAAPGTCTTRRGKSHEAGRQEGADHRRRARDRPGNVTVEYAGRGVTCNAVLPGMIGTEKVMAMPKEIFDQAVGQSPTGRPGDPAEVAHLIAFLCSEMAGHINRVDILIDGGAAMNSVVLGSRKALRSRSGE